MHLVEQYFAVRRWPKWGWFDVGHALVCVPKKNGSTSFRFSLLPDRPIAEFLARFKPMTNEQAESAEKPKFLAVRDPMARFASLWRTIQKSTDFKPLAGLSPDALLDTIEPHLHADAHWRPQSDYEIAGAQIVPYQSLLIRASLPVCWTKPPGVEEVPSMPEARIREIYARDAELWQRVN